jgi:hypothetical protein
MKKRCFSYAAIVALCLLPLIIGCGSSGSKEGTAAGVATVSEQSCLVCHSTSVEKLSGDVIGQNYATSVHSNVNVGCQDCHGAGGAHNGVGPIPIPSPSYAQCASCHDSGTATSYALVTQYLGSQHKDTENHLEGSEPCNRCHTHQGAVLSAVNHFTGDGYVMESGINATADIADADIQPIKCITCHVTHKPQKLRVDTEWNPSTTVGVVTPSSTNVANDQYRLCTQCHGYINQGVAKLMGSGTSTSGPGGTGTALIGHHDTSWYRIIATTHNQDATALAAGNLTGYGMRFTLPNGSANPSLCFDCHGHEAYTGSRYGRTTTPTIYTDWAQSGHARGLLTAKYAAADTITVPSSRTDPNYTTKGHQQVDAVMAASVTAGAFGTTHASGSCGRCHSTEGFSYYFENLAAEPNNNNLAGILKCYGCHTNPGAGALRTLKGAKATTNYTTDLGLTPPGYTLNYGKKAYPDVAASNICIFCHDSREKDPGAITDTNNANYYRTHYLQSAATMYVKMGFIAFTDTATTLPGSTNTYRNTLLSDQDSTGTGTITSYHRRLGTPAIVGFSGITAADTKLVSRGPCVTCHFTGSHSQKIDQKAIDAVCSKCHTSEAGHSILTKADFDTYFLEPQSEAYQAALTLAITIFNSKNTGVSLVAETTVPEFVRAYRTSTLVGGVATDASVEAGSSDWTTAMGSGAYTNNTATKTKLLGAVSNIVFLKREPGAYVHARTYSRRLLYDTIDFLDDGVINNSVSATAITLSGTVGSPVYGLFGKGTAAFTDSTLTTLSTGTTEAMTYLIGWSHSTGAWYNASQVIGNTGTLSERP